MRQPPMNMLLRRLERLERENRWWKVCGTTVMAVLSVALLIGATRGEKVQVYEEVRAKRFTLVDDQGKTWADLRLEKPKIQIVEKPSGRPAIGQRPILTLYDEKGETLAKLDGHTGLDLKRGDDSRIWLTLFGGPHVTVGDKYGEATLGVAGGARLNLTDKNSKAGGTISLILGSPHLALRDKNGETRASLSLNASGQPNFSLWDNRGNIRAGLAVSDKGYSSLNLDDKAGKASISMITREEGLSYVGLSDKDGKIRISMGIGSDGVPHLELADKDEKTRAVLGSASLEASRTGAVEKRPESSLVLFDKDGKVIWSAP